MANTNEDNKYIYRLSNWSSEGNPNGTVWVGPNEEDNEQNPHRLVALEDVLMTSRINNNGDFELPASAAVLVSSVDTETDPDGRPHWVSGAYLKNIIHEAVVGILSESGVLPNRIFAGENVTITWDSERSGIVISAGQATQKIISVSAVTNTLSAYNGTTQLSASVVSGDPVPASTAWSIAQEFRQYATLSSASGATVTLTGNNASTTPNPPTVTGACSINKPSATLDANGSTTVKVTASAASVTGQAANTISVPVTASNSTADSVVGTPILITIPGQGAQTVTSAVVSYSWEVADNVNYITLTNTTNPTVTINANNQLNTDVTAEVKCTITWANNTTATKECLVTVRAAVPQVTYYWYVGQTNPATMSEISPIVSDTTSSGWRLIGDTLPTSGTTLFDGTGSININSSKVTYYFAVNSTDINLGIYDSLGNEDTQFVTGPTQVNGWNVYTTTFTAKSFNNVLKVK